jgi:hypothetical protein
VPTKYIENLEPIIAWRAIYKDWKIYTGTTHKEWKALPADGFVVGAICHPNEHTTMLDGHDWYGWDGEVWFYVPSVGENSTGEWEPKPSGCEDCIKRGVAVDDEEFNLMDTIALAWARETSRKNGANLQHN